MLPRTFPCDTQETMSIWPDDVQSRLPVKSLGCHGTIYYNTIFSGFRNNQFQKSSIAVVTILIREAGERHGNRVKWLTNV